MVRVFLSQIMSHPVNDEILESISEKYEIRACCNGVGEWEIFYEGDPFETFDTLEQAQNSMTKAIQKQFEEMCQ